MQCQKRLSEASSEEKASLFSTVLPLPGLFFPHQSGEASRIYCRGLANASPQACLVYRSLRCSARRWSS